MRSLYDKTPMEELTFDRPVKVRAHSNISSKAIAIEPEFSRSKKRQICVGGLSGELYLCWRETLVLFNSNKKKVVCLGWLSAW